MKIKKYPWRCGFALVALGGLLILFIHPALRWETLPAQSLESTPRGTWAEGAHLEQRVHQVHVPKPYSLADKIRASRKGAAAFANDFLAPIPTRSHFGELLEAMGFKTGVELGVQAGLFANETLTKWPSCSKYYLIDIWAHQVNYKDLANVEDQAQDNLYRATRETLQRYEGKTVFIRNFTKDAVHLVPDGIDFVYVDARHDYCGTTEDLELYWSKLRPGGLLAGHDYVSAAHAYPQQDWSLCMDGTRNDGAVMGAVNEFAISRGLQVIATTEDGLWRSWMIRKPLDANRGSSRAGSVTDLTTGGVQREQRVLHAHIPKPYSLAARIRESRDGAAVFDNDFLAPIPTRSHFGELLEAMGFKTGVELGVQAGLFANETLTKWPSCSKYYLIDIWAHQVNYKDLANVEDQAQDNLYRATRETLQRYEGKTVFIRNFTKDAVHLVPDGIDFVYVDARHDFCGTTEDLELYWPKVRPGGLLAGHDYVSAAQPYPDQDWSLCMDGTRNDGAVMGAVNEFASSRGLQVIAT